jgi:hypothetical protein
MFGGAPAFDDQENYIKLDDVYKYDMPLYKKMVFRFRNTNNSPFQLCKQVDPNCQQYILV